MSADQQMMDQCLEQCFAVVHTASRCADSCLGGDQASQMVRCIRLCLDAQEMAGVCAGLIARNSQFTGQVCGVCAAICDACAAECEKYEVMRECATACRQCAEACRAA